MIQEETIERILARLESGEDDFETEIQDFAVAQPHLMAYLTDEENEAFTDEERDILVFGAIVIYQSITDERTEPERAEEEEIGQAEEANYAVMESGKGSFHDRLTPFFEHTKEEDLLAFIEDLLVYEAEDESITKEAREPLFVTLKTVVDVLTA